jgi:hypothetical protein
MATSRPDYGAKMRVQRPADKPVANPRRADFTRPTYGDEIRELTELAELLNEAFEGEHEATVGTLSTGQSAVLVGDDIQVTKRHYMGQDFPIWYLRIGDVTQQFDFEDERDEVVQYILTFPENPTD